MLRRTALLLSLGAIGGVLSVVGFAATATAADSTPVLAGSYTGALTLSKDWGGAGFGAAAGKRTFDFGTCSVGSSCTANRTDAPGQPLALKPSGGGFSYSTSTKSACTDRATGALRSNVAFDQTIDITLTPSATETRNGVTYVTALTGTYKQVFAVNDVGRGLNCTVDPDQTPSETEIGTYQLKLVALAKPKAVSNSAPLALPATPPGATGSTTGSPTDSTTATINPDGSATLPRFGLPQTALQQDSAAAVATGQRSSIAGALVTPTDAIASIQGRLAKDLLLLALLGLLLIFPAQLFNSTYDENSDRIDRQLAKLKFWRRKRSRNAPPKEHSRARRVGVYVLCTLIGTLLAGFLDPSFGLNTASYALTVGVLVSVLVAVVVGVLAGNLYRSAARQGHEWQLAAVPSALTFAVLCVAVSRLTGFQPGYLYGALGGAAFLIAMEARHEGRAEVTVTLATLVVALAAWAGFGQVVALANADDPTFVTLSADATLAALFIGGLEGLLFALIPLKILPGSTIMGWSKTAWVVLFAVVGYLFVHVLLAPESGYLGRSTEASTAVTLALFAFFAVTSILFWGYFKVRPTRETPEPAASEAAWAAGGQQPAMAGAGAWNPPYQGQQGPPPEYWQQPPPQGQWQPAQGPWQPPQGQWQPAAGQEGQQGPPPEYWQQPPAEQQSPPPPPAHRPPPGPPPGSGSTPPGSSSPDQGGVS